ncbi:bumetanide-sensitive sodium-(potassium)-chloride cotransporter-like [Helicoverpa zea]|uniref:bumetanide-sensitive sodium-(potassium)-chloride cotransporter-like n=1 Tax=Helicoverpa zea TaxID=7113 RepID=UPI001F58BF8F|nr:bumetanide-sensitive sodium-(potassium)-chloride cotransporter-like [Helicoverpa zea]
MDERLLKSHDELALKTRKITTSMGPEMTYDIHRRRISSRDELAGSTSSRHGEPTPELTTYGGIKLGWVQGVLIPCLLNIWGVMLFLRMAWIVAQAGIGLSILIIFISGVVCCITTLSLSAICTNGELQGGGVYFLVSRSLGAELGASVGIIFAFANAVAASMNTIGFCDSLNELLKANSVKIIDNGPNDTRIVGAIALFVMCVICAIGMDWETKTQNFLITVILTAIANFILGAALGPGSDQDKARGFVGLSLEQARVNWSPDFRYSEGSYHDFFSVFAIYFPAVTGVQAGANICGDLKDPATAIPKGTFLALAISITSYLTMATLSGVGGLRDASGNTTDIANGSISDCKPNCNYGLHNSYEIMHLMAFFGPLIYAGCWAATLSTALTNLLSVPRLIQALGFDRIYPGLIFFSKRYGRHGEPYRGYVLTFLVSVSFLLIADLNTIAPLITNFYLASYALINFCTFHAAFFKPLNWRPRFRFYNTWVSLSGFLLCLVIMMVISWVMALLTTFIFITLYLLVLYRKPETSWGSSTDAQRYQETISSIVQLYHMTAHAKAFNPQLLILSGKLEARPWLVDLGTLITKTGSFMILAEIEPTELSRMERNQRQLAGEEWLRERKLRGFYVLIQGEEPERSLRALVQATGLGRMAPNIVLYGFKYNWAACSHNDLLAYYHMIRLTFRFEMSVAILYVPTNMRPKKKPPSSVPSPGADTGAPLEYYEDRATRLRTLAVMSSTSDVNLQQSTTHYEVNDFSRRSNTPPPVRERESYDAVSLRLSPSQISRTGARRIGAYKPLTFNSNSILDAWWLYDDGGMNILLPYIIARRSVKEKMMLRIFALPRGKTPIIEAQKQMSSLLKKFRIDYTQLTMVTGLADKPAASTWTLFNNMIKNHRTVSDDETLISDEEAVRLYDKTSKHLRLRELLIENSFGADFIVMTLPFPRQGISAAMYMAWMSVMSQDMPPLLFVRGNSTVVIA